MSDSKMDCVTWREMELLQKNAEKDAKILELEAEKKSREYTDKKLCSVTAELAELKEKFVALKEKESAFERHADDKYVAQPKARFKRQYIHSASNCEDCDE